MTEHSFHFYTMAWLDLIEGAKLPELQRALNMYLSVEDYEACTGIQTAMNEYIYYIHIRKKLLKR